jgi:hypothetical protein
MKLSTLITKIENSTEFSKFKEENPKAELCAGFFILDFKPKKETYNLDYKTENKIFSFNLNTETEEVTQKEEEIMEGKDKLEPINPKINIDIEDLKEFCEEEFLNNKVGKKIEKIIAILQKKEDKTIWNLTCMAEGFSIILINVDSLTRKILKFEKKSLFDIVTIKKKEK